MNSFYPALPNSRIKPNLWAFQPDPNSDIEQMIQDIEKPEKEDEWEKVKILCKNCKNPITSAEHIMEINGRHEHFFNNPHGFFFHIGCFSAAFGCARSGVPTSEYTWFAGFSWCFALCSKCQIHLGWHFLAGSGENFYGLILNQLIEGES